MVARVLVTVNSMKQPRSSYVILSYQPPYDWKSHLAFLAYRSIPGVEVVKENSYARTISMDGIAGHFRVEFGSDSNQIQVEIQFPELKLHYYIIERIKSIFDLYADSEQIDKFLAKDKLLKPMVKKFPGLRVPGCWSGFEVAVRAILGQQITVKAASTLVSRISERYGHKYDCNIEGLTHVFPDARGLQGVKMGNIGIIRQRTSAIQSIADLVSSGELIIDCTIDMDEFVDQICAIKGIGEWTAFYIAMRALNETNAFPFSDLILRRALTKEELTPKQLLALSEPWQPWRAYAVILLWKNYGATILKVHAKKKKS